MVLCWFSLLPDSGWRPQRTSCFRVIHIGSLLRLAERRLQVSMGYTRQSFLRAFALLSPLLFLSSPSSGHRKSSIAQWTSGSLVFSSGRSRIERDYRSAVGAKCCGSMLREQWRSVIGEKENRERSPAECPPLQNAIVRN